MQVTIELPEEVAAALSPDPLQLPGVVRDSVLASAVRGGALTPARVRRILGLSRYEMDGWLKLHRAGYEMTFEELERDTAAAAAFAGR